MLYRPNLFCFGVVQLLLHNTTTNISNNYFYIHSSIILYSNQGCRRYRTYSANTGNTPWMGHQYIAGHHRHISYRSNFTHFTYFRDFGRWVQTGEPEGNPHGHTKNMQSSMQTVTWAHDWTGDNGNVMNIAHIYSLCKLK